jgi:hypothetical protein
MVTEVELVVLAPTSAGVVMGAEPEELVMTLQHMDSNEIGWKARASVYMVL